MEAAAQLRDTNALYSLVRQDPYILDKFDRIPFIETPLHDAARSGNVELTTEIIRLKPSFAKKPNQDGFSPMHLALQNGQTQTVLQLIDTDPELVRVKGREGITPLHHASEDGDLYLLEKFLSVCPKSLEDVTNKGDTALHIALKNDKVEAFQVLTRCPPSVIGLKEADQCYNKRILNSKNRDGSTLLHIATSKNQVQIVRCLLNYKVEINSLNSDGLTPLNITLLDQTQSRNQEIEDMLRSAGALEATSLPIRANSTNLLRTDQRLNEAAQAGNVDALYELIWEDAYLLDQIDQVPFVDTPLHTAASMGHINFALEIMRLKPSFARKQNQYGFCPLHLALQETHTQMVLRLIDVDRNLVRVQGREGVTPLHYVAEKGNVDLLCKFLAACPESILQVTIRKETALHVAAKNDKLEVLEVMLGWLRFVNKDDILNWKDDECNTLLHISISRSHIQIVRLIVNRARDQINARNSKDKTAMDMVKFHLQTKPEFQELKSMVRNAGGREGSSLATVEIADYLKRGLTWRRKMLLFFYSSSLSITDESRNALLVVAVLIATATFQAALTPSQDLWGNSSSDIDSATNVTATSINNNQTDQRYPVSSSYDFYDPIITVISGLFSLSNIIAFSIAMQVINHHLPNGFATTLVYPLAVCFFLLVTGTTPVLLFASFIFLFILQRLLYIQLDFSKIRFRRSIWIAEVLGPVLQHYRSFRNEKKAADP
ncbi:ankyrin-1 [Citrus clementina]|uniref:ankyrin-1 n=1 Tax=Citrus clementina TaxID=85681 RepID=UPI000CED1F06|nr:ankyrin-1 [Citrus x clementina]